MVPACAMVHEATGEDWIELLGPATWLSNQRLVSFATDNVFIIVFGLVAGRYHKCWRTLIIQTLKCETLSKRSAALYTHSIRLVIDGPAFVLNFHFYLIRSIKMCNLIIVQSLDCKWFIGVVFRNIRCWSLTKKVQVQINRVELTIDLYSWVCVTERGPT